MNKIARAFTDPKLLVILLLGFSSGLPLLLVGATLKAWMFQSGVDLKTIGYFSLVKLPYTWKVLWAPILDRYRVAPFGRRRGWMLIAQGGLIASLVAFSRMDPARDTGFIIALAVLAAFFSASQDIAIDAYRREVLPTEELGLGSSLAVFGYRMGTLVAGSGAFILADQMAWPVVYLLMAVFMLVGVITAFVCPEPEIPATAPTTLRESVVGPLREFFGRPGAATILAFILFYKVGEALAGDMYNPFFLSLGFSNTEIGTVSKLFGVWSSIAGGIAGGVLMVKLGIYRSLWIFGILQSLALLLFTVLAGTGHSLPMLGIAVGSEYFTSGMATTAYVAFMATQSNRRFTAVQYALLTSLMGLPAIVLGALTGHLADALGWSWYFVACAVLTIPGLVILTRVRPLLNAEAQNA